MVVKRVKFNPRDISLALLRARIEEFGIRLTIVDRDGERFIATMEAASEEAIEEAVCCAQEIMEFIVQDRYP